LSYSKKDELDGTLSEVRTEQSAEVRSLRAQIAALQRWAHEDTVAGTVSARAGFNARFDREVDPDNILEPGERSRRAERAKKAYFLSMALRSAQVRRAKRLPLESSAKVNEDVIDDNEVMR